MSEHEHEDRRSTDRHVPWNREDHRPIAAAKTEGNLVHPDPPATERMRPGPHCGCRRKGAQHRSPDDRHLGCARPSARRLHKNAGEDRCIGRSRAGLTTRINALVDASGRSDCLDLAPGQTHDNRLAADLPSDLKPRAMLPAPQPPRFERAGPGGQITTRVVVTSMSAAQP